MGKRKLYTDEHLLDILRKEAKKLGKAPSSIHFARSTVLPSPSCYIYRWGSWNKALKAAGLKPNLKNEQKIDEFTLLREKPRLHINLGSIPKEKRKKIKKIFIRGYKTIYYLEGDEIRAVREFLTANMKKLKKRKLKDINKYNLPIEMVDLIKKMYHEQKLTEVSKTDATIYNF
ncbi:MAG: hypothetical protein DRN18_01045 [Thermoplasmata archaeon]|nr:MAG: hypothetical protein DRN18_01045 [Thermoplasmata archaeon]